MRISFVDPNIKYWEPYTTELFGESAKWWYYPGGRGRMSMNHLSLNGVLFNGSKGREIFIRNDMSFHSTLATLLHELMHTPRIAKIDRFIDRKKHYRQWDLPPIDQRIRALLPRVYWYESFAITASFIITFLIQRMIW